jgi:hypothetical protein
MKLWEAEAEVTRALRVLQLAKARYMNLTASLDKAQHDIFEAEKMHMKTIELHAIMLLETSKEGIVIPRQPVESKCPKTESRLGLMPKEIPPVRVALGEITPHAGFTST